jgi:RNA polymerase sigma factor (sigma-70 family)
MDDEPRQDQKDSQHRLTPEQQELVEKNLRLVSWVMKRYANTRVVRDLGWEDCFSAGVIGLIRAAIKFDGSRGVQFSTYAAYWIRGAMQDAAPFSRVIRNPHIAYRRYRGKEIKDLVVAHSQGSNEIDLTTCLVTPSHEEEVDARIDAESYLECLTPARREIVQECCYVSTRQVAKKRGCTYQNIDQILFTSMRVIRRKFKIRLENGK